MWQRKQTIYLVLVIFVMAIASYLTPLVPLQISGVLICLMALYTIFKYQRPMWGHQKRMCRYGQILLLAWIGYFAYDYAVLEQDIKALPFYICLPIVAIILYGLAHKGICDDDKLLKRTERLRG